MRREARGRRSAFTLIEILTVIVIIAILVALIFPAIKAAIIKAESARARTMVQHTSAAFRAYFTEFSMWPTNSDEMTVLDLTTNLFANTASITFLDVTAKDIGTGGKILDPWQKPYHYIVDGLNYRGYVQPSGWGTITNGYVIWSDGPDGTNDIGALPDVGLNKDNIRSW